MEQDLLSFWHNFLIPRYARPPGPLKTFFLGSNHNPLFSRVCLNKNEKRFS